MISFGVLLMVLLGFTRAMISTNLASETNHEAGLAKEAARQQIELLQATSFGDVFVLYNNSAADDPDGFGTGPGSGFDVPGLDPREDDADGMVGEVLFPTTDGAPGVLREDLVFPSVGMPMDLDGDGVIDALDHTDDHLILPVLVRLEWRGASGQSKLELRTLLGGL